MGYKAFLLGVNTHGLKYSESDAQLMDLCLAQHGYKIIKPYKKEKRSILEQFEDMLDKCDKTDTVIFYFSGHASLAKGKLRLVLDDANNLIRISEITETLQESRATNKLIILDCCHAGAATTDLQLDLSDAYSILTASTRLEKGKEIDDFKAGFLTYQIHQALINNKTKICVENNIKIYALYEWLKNAAEQHNVKHSVKVPIPNLFGNAKNDFQVVPCDSVKDNRESPRFNEVIPQKKYQINVYDLRTHLPNRREQETKLGRAIHTHHNKQHPLVCLIHSDESQCSDRFVKRLVQHYIPQVVARDNIRSHFVPCKLNENIDLQQEFSEQLASKLGINPFATRSEIVQAIVRERSPIIFSTDMCTNNWLQCGQINLIHDFIKFWAKLKLPESHNHLLLVFLYFNYQETKTTNFFRRWFKKKSINDKIRDEFIQLEQENLQEKFGINCVILPELKDIEQDDVEKWAKEYLRVDVWDDFMPEIKNLFKSSKTVSMCDVAKRLREILKEFPPNVFKF
jgi:hypothetical protein